MRTFTADTSTRQDPSAADTRNGNVDATSLVFSGTPAVRIRMLPVRSAPVRTPSYMPRGNFQFLRVRGLKDVVPADERDQPRDLVTVA
jgi:hypothetical protein